MKHTLPTPALDLTPAIQAAMRFELCREADAEAAELFPDFAGQRTPQRSAAFKFLANQKLIRAGLPPLYDGPTASQRHYAKLDELTGGGR